MTSSGLGPGFGPGFELVFEPEFSPVLLPVLEPEFEPVSGPVLALSAISLSCKTQQQFNSNPMASGLTLDVTNVMDVSVFCMDLDDKTQLYR
ncbi:hypothetical protein [Leptolyngbya sp. FACHB-261]|uniref:hypothetical protein n=1 Tax=Leptolyngbya sp. FACHB-261 TaxID=2692806 RepID=UPI0018F007C5|nr:hypothetical protein [Leptolyngbya sp. FACHB-261]